MEKKRLHQAAIVVMLLGVAFSLIQFLYNRSIWLDEAMLSLNIINRNYAGLLKPLDYLQVAPIGFLFIEKFFSTLIPNSEYGLRIFPLLSFWISIYLFYKIITLLIKDAKITLLAVSLFCLNTSLLYYSSEVKQYMVDVFICLLMYYFLLKEYKNNNNRYILLALFGALSILLSNVSIIALFTVSVFLLVIEIKHYKWLAIPFITWAIVFCIYYYKFIHNHPNRNNMLVFWGNSFMPLNIFDLSFWDFCFYKTKMIFGSLLSFGVVGLLPFLFFIIGLYKLIREKQGKLLILLMLPILLHLILSAFKLYPFDLRLILYQAGFSLIVIAIGAVYIIGLNAEKNQKKWFIGLFSILSLLTLIELLKNYPSKTEEIKSSTDFMKLHVQPNDKIYVYYGAAAAFQYYQKIEKIDFQNQIIFGQGHKGENQKYIEEIKNNRGKCWVLFSHIYDKENSYITTSLDTLYNKEFSYKTVDSEVYLYDITTK